MQSGQTQYTQVMRRKATWPALTIVPRTSAQALLSCFVPSCEHYPVCVVQAGDIGINHHVADR